MEQSRSCAGSDDYLVLSRVIKLMKLTVVNKSHTNLTTFRICSVVYMDFF